MRFIRCVNTCLEALCRICPSEPSMRPKKLAIHPFFVCEESEGLVVQIVCLTLSGRSVHVPCRRAEEYDRSNKTPFHTQAQCQIDFPDRFGEDTGQTLVEWLNPGTPILESLNVSASNWGCFEDSGSTLLTREHNFADALILKPQNLEKTKVWSQTKTNVAVEEKIIVNNNLSGLSNQ